MSEQFHTIQQASEIFQVAPKTIQRWIKQGELRAVRIGGATRIPQSAIDAIAASADQEAASLSRQAAGEPCQCQDSASEH